MRPILFRIGSLPIRSYGLMIALAFLVGIWIARRRFKARGLNPDIVIDLGVLLIITSVAGARGAYVISHWDYFSRAPLDMFKIWEGGLALYGGIVVGVIVGLVYFARRHIYMWAGADLLAPSLAIGIAIGRVGCFLNGCCFGQPCELPWAVAFGPHSPAGEVFPNMLIHPTQLYESLIALGIFFVLLAVERRKPFEGFLFWLFVALLSVSRFFVDTLRHYETESIFIRTSTFQLTNNQAMGIGLVILSAFFMFWLAKHGHRGLMVSKPPTDSGRSS
jgi:phosphatidylglycerol---prolipoprotein diacylglyceryl transferase